MDKSPPISLPVTTVSQADWRVDVRLPSEPLSPWLRLAHVSDDRGKSDKKEIPLRVLNDFEIVFQTHGNAWIGLEAFGGSMDICAGDVVFIPPGLSHSWASLGGSHMAAHFDLHASPGLPMREHINCLGRTIERRPLPGIPHLSIKGSPVDATVHAGDAWFEWKMPLVSKVSQPKRWQKRMNELVCLGNHRCQSTPVGQMAAMEILAWIIGALQQGDSHQGLVPRADVPSAILEMIDRADVLCRDHPSVSEMARQAHMGITSFREAFVKATGRPPREYWEELRMQQAIRDLAEYDMTISDIAQGLGYKDVYHFSRVFKRVMGHSPRAYRDQMIGRDTKKNNAR